MLPPTAAWARRAGGGGEAARSEEGHGLVEGFGGTVRRAGGKRDAQVGGVWIRDRDDPCCAPGKVDGVPEPALPSRIERGVDRRDDLAYAISQTGPVLDGDGAELAQQIVVSGRRRTHDCGPSSDGELGRDHPDRARSPQHEQGLVPF